MLKMSAWLLHSIWCQGSTCRTRQQWGCTCVKSTLLSSHRKRRAQLVFEQQCILVGRIFLPERSHGCFLLSPLTGNKEGSKSLMVLRVKATPTRFPTINLYTPMDNTPCILYQVCSTRGRLAQSRTGINCQGNWLTLHRRIFSRGDFTYDGSQEFPEFPP